MIFIHIRQYIQYKRCGKEARPESPAVILHSLNEPMLCKCFLLLVQQAQIQRTDELCLPVGIQGVAGQRDKLTVCLRAAAPVFFKQRFILLLSQIPGDFHHMLHDKNRICHGFLRMRQEDIFPIVREYIRRFRPLSVGMPVIDNVLFRLTLQRQVVPRRCELRTAFYHESCIPYHAVIMSAN